MAREPLIPLEDIDPERTVFGIDEIRKRCPQRHEVEMLARIVHFDPEAGTIAGIKEVREDEFWVRGHFPGRPVLPGVLMLEAAGQLSTFHYQETIKSDAILGFGGADDVKFRGTVTPPADLLFLGKMVRANRRTARFLCQAVLDGHIVFEASILGVTL